MKRNDVRPDLDAVLGGLKDFQRRTVDHVFQRLYLDEQCTHRMLIADEVGLGKTLVARGVIARAIHYLWERVDRIDIVYVCSNSDIARQNINRLNVTGDDNFAVASRITLLPLQVRDMQRRGLNFVSFTPGTSFDLGSQGGRRDERIVLYHLLKQAWSFRGTAPRNVFAHWVGHERFQAAIDDFDVEALDSAMVDAFTKALAEDEASGRTSLRDQFNRLCELFARHRKHVPTEERNEQTGFIGRLRTLLAHTCISQLQPDLVILDEFQRFKWLLDEKNELASLAHALFNYSDEVSKARVLLLSATPYKMYTLSEESDQDDHYADFLGTLRFLQQNLGETSRVDTLLKDFRQALTGIGSDTARIRSIKTELEALLRKTIVRTERLAATPDRSGMLTEHRPDSVTLQVRDITSYRTLQKVARAIEGEETLEYWKAAPYLLNFMDEYKLKRELRRAVEDDGKSIAEILHSREEVLLPAPVLTASPALDPPHARLRWLLEHALGGDACLVLWIPPSLPYYELSEPFRSLRDRGYTKQLLFSAWRVVPKAIAALLTYEAERRIFSPDDATQDLTKRRLGLDNLLAIRRTDDRAGTMSILCLLYPSVVLAQLGDPLSNAGAAAERLGSLEGLVSRVERQLADALRPLLDAHGTSGKPDESWYWAAPLLLDIRSDGNTLPWLKREDAAERWRFPTPETAPPDGEDETAWGSVVKQAQDLATGRHKLGSPPSDLARVLALMAIGSPAVCALRALARTDASAMIDPNVRDAAGAIAFGFRSLFNLPEATAIVRRANAAEPYWLRVLDYSAGGNLQSVLDEYIHVLRESEGKGAVDPRVSALLLAEVAVRALELRAAAVGVDQIATDPHRGTIAIDGRRMRARFAARFGVEEEAEAGEQRTRSDHVRAAFNSPFWPFVLATTSVGQEGLDFHQYCHSVIHWNLPANPVDLEQREGRVHRYKGHAVRKNIAARHGSSIARDKGDPWQQLFVSGEHGRALGEGDLVPYWLYPVANGSRIERHVPLLPLSRDVERLAELRRTLAVYRMVFGQPRQEELVDFLRRSVAAERIQELLKEQSIDLSPAY